MEKFFPLLSNLSFEELSNLCATNSEYQKACENDVIWETLYHRDFGVITDRPVVSWKFEYLLQKNQPKMALIETRGNLISMNLPHFPSGHIKSVDYIENYLLILETSGNLYYTNLKNPGPYSFQLVEGKKISGIGKRSGFAISTEGELLGLGFDQTSNIVYSYSESHVKPFSQLASEIISKIFDGPRDTYFLTKDNKLFHYYRSHPIRVEHILSDVDFVWPILDGDVIISTLSPSRIYQNYLKTNKLIFPLRMGGFKLRGQIQDVQDFNVLFDHGRLGYLKESNLIDWTEQMILFDEKWNHRSIKKISPNFLLLKDGTVWDITNKHPLNAAEFERVKQDYSSREELISRVLPKLISFPFPESNVIMSGSGFLGNHGFFYTINYGEITSYYFDYGFQPNFLLELSPIEYAVWRNHKLTISRALFLLLLEKGIISGHPDDRHFYYQNHEINVASN